MKHGVAVSIWRATIAVDRSRISIVAPLRALTLCLIVLGAGVLLDQRELAIAASIGVLFSGVLDLGEPYSVRLRAMLWATFWCSLTCWIGTLVSGSVTWHVMVAGVVALCAGYAGSLGIHGALIGLVALVVYTIYSGSAVRPEAGLRDALVLGIGGLLSSLVAIAAWPLGRFGDVRTPVAAAFRTLALAWQPESGLQFTSPAVASAVVAASDDIDKAGLAERPTTWLRALVADIENTRLVLVALTPAYRQATQRQSPRTATKPDAGLPEDDAGAEIHAAAHALALAMARALVFSGWRRSVPGRVDQLRRASLRLAQLPDDPRTRLLGELCAHLLHAGDLVTAQWPTSRYVRRAAAPRPLGARQRLREHLEIHDLYVGHAVRLAIAIVVATALTATFDLPHSYWLPLTVAWLAKPDLAGTVTRIPARVLGTVAGVLLSAALLALSSDPFLLALWASAGAAVVLAFLWANYSVAVIGITVFVMVAFGLAGQDEKDDVVLRVLATLAAAVIVVVVAFTRPRRSGATTRDLLVQTCDAISAYSRALASQSPTAAARSRVLKTRTAATSAVAASAVEPWLHRRSDQLDPDTAAAVLDDLMEVTSALVTDELLARNQDPESEDWSGIEGGIVCLKRALDPASVSSASRETSAPEPAASGVVAPLHRAHQRLLMQPASGRDG